MKYLTNKRNFSTRLLKWHADHGRRNLPWQATKHPYKIWLAEIMLQQTSVATVIPYYLNFIASFPTIKHLADADQDAVMAIWAGLGYYARARNLHKAAKMIATEYQGIFPISYDDIVALPGIGRSTAGAILAFSQGKCYPILDGNVKRVLARIYKIDGHPSTKASENALWEIATALTPKRHVADYTQAIMDFGATLCTRHKPRCQDCPYRNHCLAYQDKEIDHYPAPRAKKTRPTREVYMLILRDMNNKILIQRRPPTGIWGGLWSLPELPDKTAEYSQTEQDSHCRELYGLSVLSQKPLAKVKHGFTHFDLNITPIDCVTRRESEQIQDAGDLKWYTPSNHKRTGFPTAVAKILSTLTPINHRIIPQQSPNN